MGGASSKAAKSAGGAVKRQYPTRVPPTPSATSTSTPPSASARPNPPSPPSPPQPPAPPRASSRKTDAIAADGYDPQLGASLRSIGPVTPNPTHSHSSTFRPAPSSSSSLSHPTTPTPARSSAPIFPSPATNPALAVLAARQELQERADAEFEALGRRGFADREFLDVVQVRQVLMMRDKRGVSPGDIEERLGLKEGVVARLGKRGIVGEAAGYGGGEEERREGRGALG